MLTEEISEIFSKNGLLSKDPEFEYRFPQQQMAISIAESLQLNEHIIIEAPTGVGKSLAYLIPSILFSKKENRKAIISTATINLQEQLIKKDIPFLKENLNIDFQTEILKGRQNYLCTKRLSKAMARHNELFDTPETELLKEIYDFVQLNNIGERQYLPIPQNTETWNNVWSEIFAEQGICTAKSCGIENSSCFYQQAKQKLKNADVIILNHYLFFTLFGFYERQESGYLYLNDFTIFDEAHLLENIAANNVSPSVSRDQLKFHLYKLYNPKTKKGFLVRYSNTGLIRYVTELLNVTDLFFNEAENHVLTSNKASMNKKEIRIREPLIVDKSYLESLTKLCAGIKKLYPLAMTDEDKDEIDNYWDKFNAFRNTIRNFIDMEKKELIYWIEVSKRPKGNITFKTSPVDMAEYFKNNVFTENRLSVCTSATLSVSKSLDYYKRTIGAEEVKDIIFDSPFDYPRQMKIHLVKNIPEPVSKKNNNIPEQQDIRDYEDGLTENIREFVTRTNGGALVLFTNSALLKRIYQLIKPDLNDIDINLLAQGSGLPKNRLLQDFQRDENSVLFGVDSFWMGVDVPGSSLRNLIITKLPFDVPDNPIVEAKIERIKEMGGNPFFDFTLPWAVIKFRQGAGRLIRNKSDEGILVILDSRVLTKNYGRVFINSLPECEIIIE